MNQIPSMCFAFLLVAGCKASNVDSQIRVVGGKPTDAYPAVVKLGGDGKICSGSFISPNVILTAGHCAWSGISYNGITPVKNIPHHGYVMSRAGRLSPTETGSDLRLLVFDKVLSKHTLKLSQKRAAAGSVVTIVGFGCDTWTTGEGGKRTGSGVKRVGSTRLKSVTEYSLSSSGSSTHGCPGDSGGPLLDGNGHIIGVTSVASTGMTRWTNLNRTENRDFINQVLRDSAPNQGADDNDDSGQSSGQSSQADNNQNTTPQSNPDSNQNDGPSTNPPSDPKLLDCNTDYQLILRSRNTGICLNGSSGYCYRYAAGHILYNRGRVACPRSDN